MTITFSRRNLIIGTSAAGVAYGLAGRAFAQEPRVNISRTAARPDKPNVIVVVLDTLRRDHVGIYGNEWIRTPSWTSSARRACA